MSGGRLRLLVVDDDPDICHLVVRYAQGHGGWEIVDPVGDTAEAERCAKQHQPDVIVLDVHLPDGSGIDAIPRLRHVAPDARIVMFSSDGDSRDTALQAGADDWCNKSDGFHSLLTRAAGGRRSDNSGTKAIDG